jgi:RND family efflux transporter MFP subunit
VGEALEIEECFAELAFDQTRTAQITAPVGGIVEEVTVDTGSVVTEHQSVARLWSASIAEAVAKAVLSHQTLQREKMLRASRVTPAKDLEQAEADHRSACQHLRTFGFTEEQIDDLAQKPQERVLLDVRTPFAGEIVQRDAVRGSLVEAGKPLFTMADCSTIWAWVSIPEATLPRVALGQTVKLKVDSLPGKTFEGKLTWISPELEPRSRMARARAVFPNPDRSLKARMFARAGIVTQRTGNAVLLTNDAVQKINGESFAFVKIDDDLYEARAVKTGVSFDGRIQVIEGLRGGEPVAVQHAFAVKSALLISRLGAGCGAD